MGAVSTELAEADKNVTTLRMSALRDQLDRFRCDYPVAVRRNGRKLHEIGSDCTDQRFGLRVGRDRYCEVCILRKAGFSSKCDGQSSDEGKGLTTATKLAVYLGQRANELTPEASGSE